MNFQFDCESLLGCDSEGIAILEPSQKDFLKIHNFMAISQIVDAIGNLSSVVRFILY